jgi:serine/threonine-protein kinase RIO1
MNNSVKTQVSRSITNNENAVNAIKRDKNDRATVDMVLDPRTLIIIHKLKENDKIT